MAREGLFVRSSESVGTWVGSSVPCEALVGLREPEGVASVDGSGAGSVFPPSSLGSAASSFPKYRASRVLLAC